MGIYYFFTTPTFKMVRMSVMNDALKNICNAEKAGKRQVILRPISKTLVKFLKVMQAHGYIGAFEIIDDARGGKICVDLNGRLNKCGVISPNFDLKLKNFENFCNAVLEVLELEIEVGGDDSALVESSVEVNADLSTAAIIDDLELTNVTVCRHNLEELDEGLGDWSEDNLSFASFLGVADVLESIVHDGHANHFECGCCEKVINPH